MITRRQFFQMATAAAAAPLVPGLSFAASPDATHNDSVLQACVVPEPSGWVAGLSISNPAVIVSVNLFDGLITYDDALKPVPQLARSWEETPDRKTVTFHLRDDVKWHDGKPFTSADVQYSLMEVTKRFHPRGGATFATLTAVETPDAHTAIFRFSSPVPALWAALGGFETQILPKHLYDGTPPLTNPLNAQPIGNGPYKFVEWQRGNFVMLERNPDYWDKTNEPHFERIIFRIIPDAGARLTALQSGDLRYAPTDAVPLPDLVRLQKDPRFVVSGRPFDGIAPICFFDFNMRRKQFQDLRVRQAFAHAIDRNALARIVWYGLAKPAQGPIPSYQKAFFKSDLPQYAFDPARAEALLDAAGLKRGSDGVRLRLNNLPLPFGNQYTLTAQFIQAQLRRIGVELQLIATDVPTFNRRAYADYDFDTITNWYSAFADPQLGVTRRYWSKQIKPGSTSSNASGYSTPEMDRAIEGLVSEADPVKRKPFIDAMQLIAQQQVPSINLLELHLYSIHAASLKGFSPTPVGAYSSLASVQNT
ncbi:ABC transporter substrate-binding protein [Caballeronia sp. LZ034LL]|uniref:ABC transporter substrate-binding protein n=1 Tax=Caballeronia sp. LZ034LL TaxID=3038567 RepID=UPI0028615D25|nr:ABC transporter substrate-binding protein [Caballeronia sp. LZ034LL]MDR5836043.1 ABC transporter substrate-binding protein [Caballeronia sp. LZ034LL]